MNDHLNPPYAREWTVEEREEFYQRQLAKERAKPPTPADEMPDSDMAPLSELVVLDKTADTVLAYCPKPKTKAAKRRIRRKKRLGKGEGN
jgi:hypothetical protein